MDSKIIIKSIFDIPKEEKLFLEDIAAAITQYCCGGAGKILLDNLWVTKKECSSRGWRKLRLDFKVVE